VSSRQTRARETERAAGDGGGSAAAATAATSSTGFVAAHSSTRGQARGLMAGNGEKHWRETEAVAAGAGGGGTAGGGAGGRGRDQAGDGGEQAGRSGGRCGRGGGGGGRGGQEEAKLDRMSKGQLLNMLRKLRDEPLIGAKVEAVAREEASLMAADLSWNDMFQRAVDMPHGLRRWERLAQVLTRCLSVSVSRCLGVSVSRCFGVSVSRCLGVSVSRCLFKFD
jgi:hypothetical protein